MPTAPEAVDQHGKTVTHTAHPDLLLSGKVLNAQQTGEAPPVEGVLV
jgi:hypothetical protein